MANTELTRAHIDLTDRQIDQLEKTPVVTTRYTQFEEAYQLPLLIGLGALALELLVAATVVVRVP